MRFHPQYEEGNTIGRPNRRTTGLNRPMLAAGMSGRPGAGWVVGKSAIIRRVLVLLCALSFGVARAAEPNTRATLLLGSEVVKPGETVLAGVRLEMAPRWHTYWRNPGESGLATTITWSLPEGVTAGPIQWPPPVTHTAAGLTTYVHYREVVLLVELSLSGSVKPGPLPVRATVDWLECEDACLPGSAEIAGTLTVGAESKPSPHAATVAEWARRIPQPDPGLEVRAAWLQPPVGAAAEIVIEGNASTGFTPVDFYPYESADYEVLAGVKPLDAEPGRFRLAKTVKPLEGRFPSAINGILIAASTDKTPGKAVEVVLRPGEAPATPATGTSGMAPRRPASFSFGALLGMLGLAFLGGLILNVMPCVLPVIALKILGFVQQSKEEPARVRQMGWMYTLGVVVSFLILATAVILVQRGGEDASWGMQMQNPVFRVVLLVVVVLVALNLFGVFEIGLSGSAMDGAAKLAAKSGLSGAFFNGVLATALATPCTAPFLTAALGFAFLLKSGWVILLVFVFTALGLASPYVVLSWRPDWLRFVPKPGPWMVRFKVAMGFPMLATAVWLFDVAAPSYGEGGVLWLGLFLALIALAAWVWGEFVQRGGPRRGAAMTFCLALVVGSYLYLLEGQLRWRDARLTAVSSGVIKDSPDGLEWHPWSREAVARAQAAGKVVLVDFTAKWCLTCQSNKKFAIDIEPVRARLRALGGIALRADYTNRDPRITEELQRHGRAAVPTVVIFPGKPEREPLVLPTVLTPGIVLEALEAASR